ncbi:MAG: type II secretion system protein [Candidatus Paceibacterota bacterium]
MEEKEKGFTPTPIPNDNVDILKDSDDPSMTRNQRETSSRIGVSSQSERGFTLIEIIVAVGVFSIVVLVAIGSLLSLVDTNKKAQALKSVMNNLNFALENMSRNIRTGTEYDCGSVGGDTDCANGDTRLTFLSSENETITYRLNGTQIERKVGGDPFLAITASEVEIDAFAFYVTGTGESSGELQPRVTMTIGGSAGKTDRIRTEFKLQATVSQRLLDL